jgi:hypothetical protein
MTIQNAGNSVNIIPNKRMASSSSSRRWDPATTPKARVVCAPPRFREPLPARKLYGIAEIAESLDVSPETVAQLRRTTTLPEPDEELQLGPVWTARHIAGWLGEQRALLRESPRAIELVVDARSTIIRVDDPGTGTRSATGVHRVVQPVEFAPGRYWIEFPQGLEEREAVVLVPDGHIIGVGRTHLVEQAPGR